MIINSRGKAITQRNEPRLALVDVELPREVLTERSCCLPPDAALSLSAPGMEILRVPLSSVVQRSKVPEASVWEWTGSALDEGREASEWLTRYLGKAARLVRFDLDNEVRAVDARYAPGYFTAFSDGFPILVISQSSLETLNEKLSVPLPIGRFRPNILVQGCEPFGEDLWETFTISDVKFHGVKLCSRCKVPTIDTETAEEGFEPLRTLGTFRAGKSFSLSKATGSVFFGQNVVCEETRDALHHKSLSICVGANIKVLNKYPSITESMV
ncbi:hypothetical protein KP509_23G008900 [Ceratopteris richardii]|nr:hypothetical protein KP509_23G008900 [Ceratopteris richardii]